MSEKCSYCLKEYKTKEQLKSHISANHWKQVNPKRHGKSGQKEEASKS
jgi:hypothetical protein